MDLTNKIALITGGSRGLGKNSALHLAKNGADVIITYLSNKVEADKTVAEIEAAGHKAAALQLDTGNVQQFDAFVTSLKELLQSKWERDSFDFLVNNAGTGYHSTVAQTTEAEFDQLFNIHFKGVFFLTQKLLPVIANGGRVINFSTGLARFTTTYHAAYASMKGAVETFTKYLAKEVGPRGINVNVVAPGIIKTDFTKSSFDTPGLEEAMAQQTALGRVGVPDDIGGVVAFLCSEEARWVNAQRIEASGGMFL
jgi:NAD(P)-dependent dehydrogenase (short-subunit alcohol dehydrogenase family)